jgi:molybdenum cofactor synthesis domain-containing protein
MPTAAVVIIGNEILSGKFSDENGPWLISQCRALGVDVIRVAVIPDEIVVIASEVARASKEADFVFTTGGIGPTHDDTTMAGIAGAFEVDLVRHPELESLIRTRMGDGVNADALRMADVPAGTELWKDPGLRFPVVTCRNVVIFPGVPSFLQAKFEAIAHRFGGVIVQSRRFRTLERETSIAARLRTAQERWPAVEIGSYPRYETKPVSVVVTMDGRNDEALNACESWLRAQFEDVSD